MLNKDGTERDQQKGRLYKAEKVLAPFSKRLETPEEMAKYVKKVFERATIKRRYGRLLYKVKVLDGRGRRNAGGWYGGITMPKWSRTEYIVLHEIAHTLCQRQYGQSIAGHGWQYAAIYMDLVRFALGAEAGAALKASFKAHRVKFSKPKKRAPLSPEKKAELAARLALARQAKLSQAA